MQEQDWVFNERSLPKNYIPFLPKDKADLTLFNAHTNYRQKQRATDINQGKQFLQSASALKLDFKQFLEESPDILSSQLDSEFGRPVYEDECGEQKPIFLEFEKTHHKTG